MEELGRNAGACSAAAEAREIGLPIKQAFFRTRKGRTYRAVFLIVGDEVRVLRVRGPGQASVDPDSLT